MGFCIDRSTQFLRGLGYNVIRHPRQGIAPLDLVGWRQEPTWLGSITDMMNASETAAPAIETGLTGTGIDGQSTSRLPISLGLEIFGAILSSLGGNLGVKASFESAQTLEFHYANVTRDRVKPLELGAYLRASETDWTNPVLKEYLFGRGRLYVILDVVRSDTFGVTANDKNKSKIELDVPAIKGAVGANISVAGEGEGTTRVTFKGGKALAFGFTAAELAAVDDPRTSELTLSFKPANAGDIHLKVGAVIDQPPPLAMLHESGVIDELADKT